MTPKINRIVPVFCLAAAIFLAALLPVSGYCENLRFVFLADSRGNDTVNLINTPVLNAINNQILALSPRPAFVVFGGDMALRGCVDGTYTFQAFKDVMAPLPNAGIALYTLVGNHELTNSADKGLTFRLANQQVFQRVFHENPGNGPAGYEHLAYSFTSPGGDAFFAVLDAYYLTADTLDTLNGSIDNTQLSWLTAQLAQTKASHKFVFLHPPYYYVASMPPFSNITYTNLWKILDDNRFDLYCCGHTHLFSRRTIDSSIPPLPQTTPPIQWRHNVVQLITGTCGAGVEKSMGFVDPVLWHIDDADNTYYFSVVDISGSKVTVTSYSGNTGAYTVFDSFTINKNAAVPGLDLLLLN